MDFNDFKQSVGSVFAITVITVGGLLAYNSLAQEKITPPVETQVVEQRVQPQTQRKEKIDINVKTRNAGMSIDSKVNEEGDISLQMDPTDGPIDVNVSGSDNTKVKIDARYDGKKGKGQFDPLTSSRYNLGLDKKITRLYDKIGDAEKDILKYKTQLDILYGVTPGDRLEKVDIDHKDNRNKVEVDGAYGGYKGSVDVKTRERNDHNDVGFKLKMKQDPKEVRKVREEAEINGRIRIKEAEIETYKKQIASLEEMKL